MRPLSFPPTKENLPFARGYAARCARQWLAVHFARRSERGQRLQQIEQLRAQLGLLRRADSAAWALWRDTSGGRSKDPVGQEDRAAWAVRAEWRSSIRSQCDLRTAGVRKQLHRARLPAPINRCGSRRLLRARLPATCTTRCRSWWSRPASFPECAWGPRLARRLLVWPSRSRGL